MRILLAVQSGVPDEVQYALHHLVKISHERGDKYTFAGFPGLAEALVTQALEMSSLFYDVKWEVSFVEDDSLRQNNVLNGIGGTPDLLDRIQSKRPLPMTDGVQPDSGAQVLSNVNEAALILRNMVMLEENAVYLSNLPLVRDFIVIALNMPRHPSIIEVQHYALEIAEQLTRYFTVEERDPLYLTLLRQLDSSDRGVIITAVRALSRISLNLDVTNRLPNVPLSSLQLICQWLTIEDEDLRSACLDFLYQYTAVTENVEYLLNNLDISLLVGQLARLLLHNNLPTTKPYNHSRSWQRPPNSATSGHNQVMPQADPEKPPKISAAIVEQLVAITDERDQASQWLRTCYEESDHSSVTQIAIWQAYNECFAGANLKRPLMSAKDFIGSINNVFPRSSAQVENVPTVVNGQTQMQPKYTMKGIKPRAVAVDRHGRPYMRCLWQVSKAANSNAMQNGNGNGTVSAGQTECGEPVLRPKDMWDHVLTAHFGIAKTDDGKFKVDPDESRSYECHWGSCTKYRASKEEKKLHTVVRHVQTHMPEHGMMSATRARHNRSTDSVEDQLNPSVKRAYNGEPTNFTFMNTQTDERKDAAGLPLLSVLVLRNLARQMAKVDARSNPKDGGWVRRVFEPVKDRLLFVMAYNHSLVQWINLLLRNLQKHGV